mgnify:CR=1 FL=1
MYFFSKLKKKIFSLPAIYQNHGLDGVYFSLLRNLGFKSKYLSILDKKKGETRKRNYKLYKKIYYKWSISKYSTKLQK